MSSVGDYDNDAVKLWHQATSRSPVNTVCRLRKMNGRIMCVTRWQKPISHRDSSELGAVASQNSKILLGRAEPALGRGVSEGETRKPEQFSSDNCRPPVESRARPAELAIN